MATCPTCRNDYASGTFCPRDGTRLAGGAEAPVLGGRYRLLRKVGQGGMGEVYEGEHLYLRRRVAVKVLRREMATDPEAVERLQREAQSTTGLGHPNIVDCIDFGYSDEGQVYLAMEWLDGENLDERLRRGPVDIPTALDIATQAASGLAEAHERGVIHRDLKPANLFVTKDRKGALVVKVLDFGIAKLAIHQTRLTGTGVLVGTPNYMAPEQAFGEGVDARTDIYALGVILYEMITGAVPFHADSPLGVLHLHTSRMPVPPSARAPDRGISSEVEELVMRCLAKKPGDRFASMHELLAALEAVRKGAAPARRVEPESDDELLAAAGGGRRRWLIVVGSLLALGCIVAIVVATSARRGGRSTAVSGDAAVAGIDAGTAIAAGPALDAGPAPDAAPVALPTIDAGQVAALALEAHGKQVHVVVTSPAELTAGVPTRLTFALSDLGEPIEHAIEHDRLEGTLELAYFKDHSVVYTATHAIDATALFTADVSVSRPGKHHVHLRLFDRGKRLDEVRFDLFAK